MDYVDPEVKWGSRDWANEQLAFAISELRGQGRRRSKLALCIEIKRRLEDHGFWWQARTLNFWIHRLQKGEFDFDVDVGPFLVKRRKDLHWSDALRNFWRPARR